MVLLPNTQGQLVGDIPGHERTENMLLRSSAYGQSVWYDLGCLLLGDRPDLTHRDQNLEHDNVAE